jgi:hypothetical protein
MLIELSFLFGYYAVSQTITFDDVKMSSQQIDIPSTVLIDLLFRYNAIPQTTTFDDVKMSSQQIRSEFPFFPFD